MYRNDANNQLEIEAFSLPFNGKLNPRNRWVILAKKIPWQQIEDKYKDKFTDKNTGKPSLNARIAFGSLVIKEMMGLSDRDVLLEIEENPYLQYFLGLKELCKEPPFHHSMMTHFRHRFDAELISSINEMIAIEPIKSEQKSEQKSELLNPPNQPVEKREKVISQDHIVQDPDDKKGDGKDGLQAEIGNTNLDKTLSENKTETDLKSCIGNHGKLLLDATCTPADITFPTDVKLLYTALEKLGKILQIFLEIKKEKSEVAKLKIKMKTIRKEYIAFIKQKKPSTETIRSTIKNEIDHISEILFEIEERSNSRLLSCIGKQLHRKLLVIQELFRQQKQMFNQKANRIDDRIVSISQPHVRPIIRGKVAQKVEFGAKISASLVNGFAFLDRLSWDNFNESLDLPSQIEAYRNRFGYYPKSVHVDQIYRTKINQKYCVERGIRLSGTALGGSKKNNEIDRELKTQDALDRIPIEGKFGQGKRRFSLNRIMGKLANTSETMIGITFIVMNLVKLLTGGGKLLPRLFFWPKFRDFYFNLLRFHSKMTLHFIGFDHLSNKNLGAQH